MSRLSFAHCRYCHLVHERDRARLELRGVVVERATWKLRSSQTPLDRAGRARGEQVA